MVRKGQAAMEYLMTYGWAILVIVIVLAALLYLGVFNLGEKVPDQCRFKVGIMCTDAKMTPATTNTLTVKLQNTMGSKMTVCNLFCVNSDQEDILADNPTGETVTQCEAEVAAGTGYEIASGQQKTLTFDSAVNCYTGIDSSTHALQGSTSYAAGERIRGKLYMWYSQAGDTSTDAVRVAVGDFQTTVQPG